MNDEHFGRPVTEEHKWALSSAFPGFGFRAVDADEMEHLAQRYAFVVEAPDGVLYGAAPSHGYEDEHGVVHFAPVDGNVPFERPSADAIEASGYRLVSP
jgi:hypothetical protein